MSEIPVVFTFDKRIIIGASIAIKSLIDCAKETTTYNIFVYHPDINDKTLKEIEKLLDNTRHKIHFEKIDKSRFKTCPINKKGSWNEIVYYRLLIPEMLEKYDKVIYSDVDVLFKSDLSDLYNTNIEDYEWAGVRAERNTPNTIGHKYFPENKNEYIYWSGLMLINCKLWRETNLFEKLIKNAQIFFDRLKFFDLDLLNITCDRILPVSFKYCVIQCFMNSKNIKDANDYKYLKDVYTDEEILDAKNNPIIVHYAGKPGKPWRLKHPPEDYKKYIDNLPRKLKQYTFRDIRKKIFSKA